jgi:hypothetical protein
MTYSTLSIIDTTRGEKLDEMKSDGRTLGAMAIETSSPQLYLDNVVKNQVEVVDRKSRTVMASWPITLAEKSCLTAALDEAQRRVFVGSAADKSLSSTRRREKSFRHFHK